MGPIPRQLKITTEDEGCGGKEDFNWICGITHLGRERNGIIRGTTKVGYPRK